MGWTAAWNPPLHRCYRCSRDRQMIVRWPVGPVCRSCYIRARSRPAACSRCGQIRVLVAAVDDGSRATVCGVCADSPHTYLCLRCGGGEEPYGRGHCVRCESHDRLIRAFGDANGELSSEAAVIVDAFMATRRARSVLEWLSRPQGGATVLRTLLASDEQVTHEALDALGERQVWSLRRSLVEIGVLPKRNEALARLTPFLRDVTSKLPSDQRQLVLTYGTWWVLRRARQQLERTGRYTASSRRSAQRRLSAAATFVEWLEAQNKPLSDLTQADVDRWLDAADYRRVDVADFLRWASRRQLTNKVKVHRRPRTGPDLTVSEEDRWKLLDRCLHDAATSDDVRAAGALVLLYGMQLSRVVELTTAHLHSPRPGVSVTGFSVTLTGPDIAVPPSMGAILRRLPIRDTQPRSAPLITGDSEVWLFPGSSATGHINTSVLSKRLKALGIPTRSARNAALISLAAELPISLVSDLFEISISTAMNWAREAGRDWNAYLAAPRREHS